MNLWYQNEWIDIALPERFLDVFYKIDDTKVRQAKVGLWLGIQSQLIGKFAMEDGYTKDIVVYAARPPINDVYGTDAQKNVRSYIWATHVWNMFDFAADARVQFYFLLSLLYSLGDFLKNS